MESLDLTMLTKLDAFDLVLRAGGRTLVEGVAPDRPEVLMLGAFRDADGVPTDVVMREFDDPTLLAVEPDGLQGPMSAVDGEAAALGYFADLEAGRARETAARFAEDAVYCVPVVGGSFRVVVGRDALHRTFVARGTNEARHHVERVAGDGRGRFLVEGWVSGFADGGSGSFVSSLWLDDGLIRRYVTLLQVPRVRSNDEGAAT